MKMKDPSEWLKNFILDRLAHDGSVVALFIGRTGSSKSGSAISLAYAMDPTFNLDRIVFNIKDFYRVSTEQHLPPGSFIIFDDAGIDAGARKWQEESNQAFGAILQTFRYKQLPTIITTPRIGFLDKQVRESVELMFVATDTKGLFKPFVLYEGPKMDGKMWHSYPEVGGIQVDRQPFPMPPQDLFDAYKSKKDGAFQRMIIDNMMRMEQKEIFEKERLENQINYMRMRNEMMQERRDAQREINERKLSQQIAQETKKKIAAEREAMRLEREKKKLEAQGRKEEDMKERKEALEKKKLEAQGRKEKILRMTAQGKTIREISEESGVGKRYILEVRAAGRKAKK